MIYIVDGPDGGGKDRLCHALQKATNYKILHLSHDNYERPFNRDLYLKLLENDNVIFNRFYFSELVYAKVKNRLCDLDINDAKAIDDVIKQKNVVVIHVTNDYKILWERVKHRGDLFINHYELKIAKEVYDIVMDKPFISKVELNLLEEVLDVV